MRKRNLRILFLLALGSLIAGSVLVSPASGIHQRPNGGTPFRVPLVPRFKEANVTGLPTTPTCPAGQTSSLHGGTLPVKNGCNNPALESVVARLGTSTSSGTRLGFGNIIVCPAATGACAVLNQAGQIPDVRVRGNSSDVQCAVAATGGANDPCPGGVGSDYDPRPGSGPYDWGLANPGGPTCGVPCSPNSGVDAPSTSPTNNDEPCAPPDFIGDDCGGFAPSGPGGVADMVATATIAKAGGAAPQGNAIRITDHWMSTPSTGQATSCAATTSCTGTVVDQPFPVPVVCAGNTNAAVGAYCGLNTTANALVPGVVAAGKAAVVEVGQIQIDDVGVDGVNGTSDDKIFGVQGIFIP